MTQLKIYGASKIAHRGVWQQLARTPQWDSFKFIQRWSEAYGVRLHEDNPDEMRIGWLEDIEDVREADVVLVYYQPGDILRGALVEAGAGIAMGKRIILVGYPGGTWMNHPAVIQLRSLDQAHNLLSTWAEDGIPPIGGADPTDEELEYHAERALDPEPDDGA